MVGSHGWAVLCRDLRIFERETELAAYRAAKVHVFLLPNQAKASTLLEFVEINLKDMCTTAIGVPPGVWKLTRDGVENYEIPKKLKRRRRTK